MFQRLDPGWFGPHVGAWRAPRALIEEVREHIRQALRDGTWERLDEWVASRRIDHQRRARGVHWAISSIEFEKVLASAKSSLDALVWRSLDVVRSVERQLALDRADIPPILWPLPWTELGPSLVAWLHRLLNPALTDLGHAVDSYSPEDIELRPHELIELAVELCVGPLEVSFGPGPFSSFPTTVTPMIDPNGIEVSFQHQGLGFAMPAEALRSVESALVRSELQHRISEWSSVRERWRKEAESASADEVIIYRVDGHRVESLPNEALGADISFPLG